MELWQQILVVWCVIWWLPIAIRPDIFMEEVEKSYGKRPPRSQVVIATLIFPIYVPFYLLKKWVRK